eukprot:29141-Pelagococcus_subviridis.AAC.4
MSISFPKRDELSFLSVFAFPNASKIGFVCNTLRSIPPPSPPPTLARYLIAIFVVSVFPAPDSPLTTTAWFFFDAIMSRYAAAAVAYTCGGVAAAPLAPLAPCPCARMTSGPYNVPCSLLNGFTAMSTGPARVYTSSDAYRRRKS